jgi:CRISPR-associated protein Cas5t
MLQLRVKAPFAAFRTFTAGSYRPTAPFLTPSAAYGLILNVAAVESRHDDAKSPMTLIAKGLPSVEIALGALGLPEVQTLYQQLHNYPVGESGKEHAQETKGSKYNIQPNWREYLSGIDAYICIRGNEWLESRIREGLSLGCRFAPDGKRRYGVPFLGDNSFLVSVLREEPSLRPARWIAPVERGAEAAATQVLRLPLWIDRQDTSRTVSCLFRWPDEATDEPPANAWVLVPPAGS